MKRITILTILVLMVAFTAQAQKPKTGNARTTTTNKTQAAPSLLGTWVTGIGADDEDIYANNDLHITFAPGNVVFIKGSFEITAPVSDAGDEIIVIVDVNAYGSYKKSGNNITIDIDQNSVTTESDIEVILSDETKAKLAEKDMNELNYEKKLEKEAKDKINFSNCTKLVTEMSGGNFSVKSLTAKTLVLDGKVSQLNFERAEEKQKNYPDGRKYVGEVSITGKPFGNGTMTWRNGDKYVGEIYFDEREGLGLMIYANGDKYVGQWDNDERNGKGTMTYKNGRVEKGIWKDGKLVSSTSTNSQTTNTTTTQPQSPIVTKTYDNGDKYVGQMKDGLLNGQGTYTWANGSKYVGEWKDDNRQGQGTMTWADGGKYAGEWKDHKRNGKGTMTWADGGKYVGEWKDDKRHGQGTDTWANGDIYVGQYKDGKHNGQGTTTSASGFKYVGEFKDGKFNGQGTMTYPDGRVEKGIWKDGKLVERQ